ncbi:kinase domain-containing protein [Favolaschia claudopus]|uniref:Kinase domain-containing protein n=1 Tax=Favolaschia claudopus TaxID=2862362 RepID=A0AAW0BEG7_9AGAR
MQRAPSESPGRGLGITNLSTTSSSPFPSAHTDPLPFRELGEFHVSRSWQPGRHNVQGSLTHRNRSPSRTDLDWERTRRKVQEKVTNVVKSIVQIAGDQILPIAAEALSVVPIPALAPAAKILDSIWKSTNEVRSNRSACLRLTDRCANLLISIRDEMARHGDGVAHQLREPLGKLEESFKDVDLFLKEQVKWTFMHRFIRREEIRDDILRLNDVVNDCIEAFRMSADFSHMAVSLRMERILEQLVEPAQASMLLAQDEMNPPSPIRDSDVEVLENLPLKNLPPFGTSDNSGEDSDATRADKLRERFHEIQQAENADDRARDVEDLHRTIKSVLEAPDHRAVTHVLQIPCSDMSIPVMMTALLRHLERQQSERAPAQSSSSPSPRIRTLTWPVDGIPARQVELLDRQFVELALEALKSVRTKSVRGVPRACETSSNVGDSDGESVYASASSNILKLSLERADIQVEPSSSSSSSSFWSAPGSTGETGVTTPLSTHLSLAPNEPDSYILEPSEARNELRYRMSLSHAFHHLGVTLPLWTPSFVELGAVGYLLKPEGAFQTLFNCSDLRGTSDERLGGIPAPSLPQILHQRQPEDRGVQTKGTTFINRFRTKEPTSIVKRSYAISMLGRVPLKYHYFQRLEGLKRWFRMNVSAIVEAYPECLREELNLVVATLNARDYTLLVNHGGEDSDELKFQNPIPFKFFDTQFHVYSSAPPGAAWGYYEPFPHDDAERKCKVSHVGNSSSRSTVLLSVLRFRPDDPEPTTH